MPSAARVAALLDRLENRDEFASLVERYRAVAELPERAPADSIARFHCRRRSSHELNVSTELMEQALIILLRNAADAVEGQESPRVAVEVRAVDSRVTLEVLDNGRGLPHDAASRVLTPFFATRCCPAYERHARRWQWRRPWRICNESS